MRISRPYRPASGRFETLAMERRRAAVSPSVLPQLVLFHPGRGRPDGAEIPRALPAAAVAVLTNLFLIHSLNVPTSDLEQPEVLYQHRNVGLVFAAISLWLGVRNSILLLAAIRCRCCYRGCRTPAWTRPSATACCAASLASYALPYSGP